MLNTPLRTRTRARAGARARVIDNNNVFYLEVGLAFGVSNLLLSPCG